MPLPEDRGLRGDGRPKVCRFRSYNLDLGQRLAAFRARYGVTRAEVARVVRAREPSAVSLWESGTNVPKGMLRERLAELLDGRRWPELRAAMLGVATDGLPDSWDRAVRWYRRASRERGLRAVEGAAVAALLAELRVADSVDALTINFRDHNGDWACSVVGKRLQDEDDSAALRRTEDAAHGLRWLELAHGLRLDMQRSLVPQIKLEILDRKVAP